MATANPELGSYQEAQAQLDEIQRLSDLLDTDPDNDDLQEELRGLALCQAVLGRRLLTAGCR